MEFEAIGTHWQIDITDEFSSEEQKSLKQKIYTCIETFDKTYSRFRDNSLITKISKKKGTYIFPDDVLPLLLLYEKLYRITEGAFTPLIGQTLSDAGYDKEYSLKQKKLHRPPPWEEAIKFNRSTLQLTTTRTVLLDFGAAGKGYLLDIIGSLLTQNNIHNYCIDAGGDILYHTGVNKSLRVGLEHPEDTTQVIGIAEIINQSICASAGNRRTWGNFHHLINPKTLTSPTNILATWVIADTAILADALATCLFFTPAEKLIKHFTFDHLIMYADYTIERSQQFPGEVFYK